MQASLGLRIGECAPLAGAAAVARVGVWYVFEAKCVFQPIVDGISG
jgi:hypothetical protein